MLKCSTLLVVAALGSAVLAHDVSGDAEWLENNAKKAGVVVMPSGLQYRILKSGPPDGLHPKSSTICTCHYEGKLTDGTEFDSSKRRGTPAAFTPSGVISGWTEALKLMRPGDTWELYIPASLGYGTRGAGASIPPGATLIFELELISLEEGSESWETNPWVWAGIVSIVLLVAIFAAMGGDGKKVTASHILVAQEAIALKVREVLEKVVEDGGDHEQVASKFAELAAKWSTCPSGKSDGGSLGSFKPGQMVPEFDKVCWTAPVGVVQGPLQTQFGFHLILVTDRPGEMPEADAKSK